MAINISGIPNPSEIYRQNAAMSVGNTQAANQTSFSDLFTSLVQQAEQQYAVAEEGTRSLLAGETDNLAQVMIDSSKSEMALNMVIQVRNKVLDAYNEIMRMSL